MALSDASLGNPSPIGFTRIRIPNKVHQRCAIILHQDDHEADVAVEHLAAGAVYKTGTGCQ